ncbi:hypothetical protein SPHINGO391_380011 [Sphingomonas aurantiaca]|uniref:Uncharacterized protein n=1 Tax=Sphingomonas aurantiaca TaxID=185949 RepID=A0A5E7YGW5_9SPHN|nr:hypothetical protein SPHINGO391_380011 [Sphingomonas aurantiaca]
MERAARRERDDLGSAEIPAKQLQALFQRGATVERDRAQIGQRRDQPGNVVARDIEDRGVGAPRASRRSDHVPHCDPLRTQRPKPVVIVERSKVAPDDRRHQLPELVLRMRIITLRGERTVARQAAKDEDSGIRVGDGREGVLELHKAHLTPSAGQSDREIQPDLEISPI